MSNPFAGMLSATFTTTSPNPLPSPITGTFLLFSAPASDGVFVNNGSISGPTGLPLPWNGTASGTVDSNGSVTITGSPNLTGTLILRGNTVTGKGTWNQAVGNLNYSGDWAIIG